MIEAILVIGLVVALVQPPSDAEKLQEMSCKSTLMRKAIRTGVKPDFKVCLKQ